MLTVAVAQLSTDNIAMLCTSGFADDIIFFTQWCQITLFHPVRQVAALGRSCCLHFQALPLLCICFTRGVGYCYFLIILI